MPIAGGAATKLTSDPALAGIFGVQPTPDGRQIILMLHDALYRLPSGGGSAVYLADLSRKRAYYSALVSDEYVVYDADGLYSVALSGGAPVQLTALPAPGTSIRLDQLNADGRFVIYTVNAVDNRPLTLMSAPIGGGSPTTLLTSNEGNMQSLLINDTYAIGVADSTLYAAPLAGGPRLQLLELPEPWQYIPVISAADGRIIFAASPANSPRRLAVWGCMSLRC